MPWGVAPDRRPTGPCLWMLYKKGLAQHLNKYFQEKGWALSWDFNIHISVFQMKIILRSDNRMTENVQLPHALHTFQIVTHLPLANLWGRNPTLPIWLGKLSTGRFWAELRSGSGIQPHSLSLTTAWWGFFKEVVTLPEPPEAGDHTQ